VIEECQASAECWKEFTSKLCASISDEGFWLTMLTHNMLKENVCSFFCVNTCGCWHQTDELGEAINNYSNAVIRGVAGRPVTKSMGTVTAEGMLEWGVTAIDQEASECGTWPSGRLHTLLQSL
jgi:hypothetical protein